MDANPMRILTFADRFASVGGIERVQLDVCRRLSERAHTISVLVKESGDLLPQWQAFADVEFVDGFTVPREMPVAGTRRVWRAARTGASCDPDVVYVHRHAMVQSAWPTALLARDAGLVCHLHALVPPRRGPITRFLLSRVSHFIAVSDAVARSWAARGIPLSRITTVRNGVDTDRFVPVGPEERAGCRRDLGIEPDAFVVVYAGRAVREKGLDVLVDATSELVAADPSTQLLVVGADPDQPQPDDDAELLRDVSRRAPVSTRWFARSVDVRPFLNAADVAVVPSVFADPNPLGVIEPLASGMPIVASAVGGIVEQLTGELADFLVTPGDSAELAAATAVVAVVAA